MARNAGPVFDWRWNVYIAVGRRPAPMLVKGRIRYSPWEINNRCSKTGDRRYNRGIL